MPSRALRTLSAVDGAGSAGGGGSGKAGRSASGGIGSPLEFRGGCHSPAPTNSATGRATRSTPAEPLALLAGSAANEGAGEAEGSTLHLLDGSVLRALRVSSGGRLRRGAVP